MEYKVKSNVLVKRGERILIVLTFHSSSSGGVSNANNVSWGPERDQTDGELQDRQIQDNDPSGCSISSQLSYSVLDFQNDALDKTSRMTSTNRAGITGFTNKEILSPVGKQPFAKLSNIKVIFYILSRRRV